MSTRRELAQQQLDLMDNIRDKAGINMVTCGHCGTILLHEMRQVNEDNSITCFGCKREMDLSDCPDYWYTGCIKGNEFDDEEDKPIIEVEDVLQVANNLGLAMLPFNINRVIEMYPAEQENDPTATWDLVVENCIYQILNDKN